MIKANIEYNYTSMIEELPKLLKDIDVIFICTTERQNAEVVRFDKPTMFLNPKENIEMSVMLEFLKDRHSKFLIVRSEYLTIPDVKEILSIFEGKYVRFTGIYNNMESKERYLSSYYLDRNYERVGE